MTTDNQTDIINHSDASAISVEQPAWMKSRLEAFMDQRFGIIIHWGLYSQWNCIESWPLVPMDKWARPEDLDCWVQRERDLDRFSRDYRALNRSFNPTQFDAEHWAELGAKAGAKYMAFTTKHHDGFCLFDTKTTDYRITHPSCPYSSSPRADVVRAVFDAIRARGMAISCYFSKSDWHCPWYWWKGAPVVDRNPNYDTHAHPDRWEQFVQFTHSQIEELMRDYGPIESLWLDGGQVRPPNQDIRMDEIAAMARRYHPELLIADRCVGGHNENYITPEQKIPEEPLGVPWESCVTLGKHWKHVENDSYKSLAEVLSMLVETASKGGNLMLGIGPDARGLFVPEVEEKLLSIGHWLKEQGEGIYGTRPIAPYQTAELRYTCKHHAIYAFVMPGVRKEELLLEGIDPARVGAVQWLADGAPLKWRKTGEGKLAVSVGTRVFELPTGLRVELKD
ncbi:MAG: alpha-L-fucosidase [Planctomycetes bacterium]|nr:alpha-L-fucosidase [Planctomycetota bacterium]